MHPPNKELSPVVVNKLNELRQLRHEIYKLSPEDALDRIVSCDHPTPLVHSIPAQDLLVLIHEIGTEDALPILAQASEQQWLYLMDAQIWKRDRLCITETTRWLYLLMKAEPNRFIQWAVNDTPEFLYFYLYQNLEILALDENEDWSDLPDSFFTLDNVYYVSLSDYRLPFQLDRETEELREELITELLKRMASYDYYEYQNMLLRVSQVLPAEYEEESFRLKNIRLESFGFLPFEEAVGVYHPISKNTFVKTKQVHPDKSGSDIVNAPQLPALSTPEENYFSEALRLLESDPQINDLQLQFAYLCNQIISADNIVANSHETLKKIVDKACSYIHIGIEQFFENDQPSPEMLKQLIKQYPVKNWFQYGFGQVLAIKWKADAWYAHSFIHSQGLTLDFWGEKWLGILGGLFLKRPRFYAGFENGELYREFRTRSDIQSVENSLKQVIALDELLSFLSAGIQLKTDNQVTYQNLLLTLFARNQLKLEKQLCPIPLTTFQPFFNALWAPSYHIPRNGIQPNLKKSFIQWFSKQTRFETDYIEHRLGDVIDRLFNDVLEELGDILFENLDPRHVNLFLLCDASHKVGCFSDNH